MTAVDPQSARQIASRLASRRSFFRLAGLGVAGVGLAACSSGTTTTTSSSAAAAEGSTAAAASGAAASTAVAPGSNGSISLQLSWIKNIEFGGEYFADSKGYYTQAGFSAVDLVTGPVDSADALVAAGNITVGISAPDATARFISEQGAPLKVIASTF
jgi:ABC-type nitrate/sulfonate/bicarbonate transport system substrate-binding protein